MLSRCLLAFVEAAFCGVTVMCITHVNAYSAHVSTHIVSSLSWYVSFIVCLYTWWVFRLENR